MPTASFDIDYAARQLFRHFLDEWRARPTLPPLLPLLGGLGPVSYTHLTLPTIYSV